MSPIPAFSIALDIRAGRIPVRWTVRDNQVPEVQDGKGRVLTKGGIERVFWPEVAATKWGDTAVDDMDDPGDIRATLFRVLNTKWNEEAALAVLRRVGAWRIVTDIKEKWPWQKGTFANVAYRHRSAFKAHVVPMTLEDMERDARYWYGLLGPHDTRTKAKTVFRTPPGSDATLAEQYSFASAATFANTLPVSLEWAGEYPRAVIEPLSALELLAAAAWADVAGRVPAQVCARCHTRFSSSRKKKYCQWECGHAEAVMNHKRKKAREKASE